MTIEQQATIERLAAENAHLQLQLAQIRRDTIEECAKHFELPCYDQTKTAFIASELRALKEVSAAIRSLPAQREQPTGAEDALTLWRAIGEEAEAVVIHGKKCLILTEEMCVRLGSALEVASAALPSAAPIAPIEEREAFEQWANKQRFDLRPSILAGRYAAELTEFAWRAWQARAALAAPALPEEPQGFYLASFKREKRDGFITWWGPNNAGYTPYLNHAGIYQTDEIEAGYHDSEYTVPVPVSFVRQFEQRVIDYGMSVCEKIFWNAENLRAAIAAAPIPADPAKEVK